MPLAVNLYKYKALFFSHQPIFFALFHITIRLIVLPMVWVCINIYTLFLIPQVVMLIALFEISIMLVTMSDWRAYIVYFK